MVATVLFPNAMLPTIRDLLREEAALEAFQEEYEAGSPKDRVELSLGEQWKVIWDWELKAWRIAASIFLFSNVITI